MSLAAVSIGAKNSGGRDALSQELLDTRFDGQGFAEPMDETAAAMSGLLMTPLLGTVAGA